MIGTLAVDGWAVTFGTARRGLGGLRTRYFTKQEAQLSQRDRVTLRVIEYFAKSLSVI